MKVEATGSTVPKKCDVCGYEILWGEAFLVGASAQRHARCAPDIRDGQHVIHTITCPIHDDMIADLRTENTRLREALSWLCAWAPPDGQEGVHERALKVLAGLSEGSDNG